MSYFQVGDYVRFVNTHLDRNPNQEGYVDEITTRTYPQYTSEQVKVRTSWGGYWLVPADTIIPISPSEEEIARRIMGEDYL